jgi:uncharacterized membrane protein YhaH (DUF805 family)
LNNPYHAPSADLSQPELAAGTYDPQVFAVNGRIGRLRYLAFSMLMGLLTFALIFVVAAIGGVLMAVTKSNTIMMVMLGLAYIPAIAVTIILAKRRFNDMGHSGWMSLLMFVPLVGFFVWLWLLFGPGDAQSNQYGKPPSANTTLVIVGACVVPFFMVAIIGILAAVAIPAYQQYTMKAQARQQQQLNVPPASPYQQ